jgi:lipopolysaccharide transport system ATP-binding protein
MSDDIAIKVENLSKCYHIYDQPRDRLKQMILPRLQQATGMQPKRYFREFWALKDVSFEVKRGETIGIIGDNGSGKSTLLQMICGTLNLSSGTIRTNGRVAALLELGSGFNPQFTGRENVYLNGAILGLSKEEIDTRFDDIAAFADIGDFIDQPVKNYSSGMYVRLAFSVIANVDAEVLLIDEALAVGDIHFSQKCMRYLDQFREKGALLFVSHNSSAVASLCNNAIWLEKGRMKAVGATKHVIERYLAQRYEAPVREGKTDSSNLHGVTSQDADLEDRTSSTGRDMRMDFLNHSNLRNDLQLFGFTRDTRGFGHGGASVIDVRFFDSDGRALAWIVGGESVGIAIDAEIETTCDNLIVGFQFKNRLGQILFAQNTYLQGYQTAVTAAPGNRVTASFKFQMPLLPKGNYSVDVAIADGEPPSVRQLQWLHDVIVIESHASSVISGLVGLLFQEIKLDLVAEND